MLPKSEADIPQILNFAEEIDFISRMRKEEETVSENKTRHKSFSLFCQELVRKKCECIIGCFLIGLAIIWMIVYKISEDTLDKLIVSLSTTMNNFQSFIDYQKYNNT